MAAGAINDYRTSKKLGGVKLEGRRGLGLISRNIQKKTRSLAVARAASFFELDLDWSISGAEGSRTLDLLHAMQALSQLSYGPLCANGAVPR